jgi:hypothetical protein
MSKHEPIDAVAVFAPWAGAEERALRVRIHKAQTIALKRAALERNGRGRSLYYVAAELAAAWVYQRVDDRALLERVLWALCQIFMAAGHIVVVEGADAD